MNSAGDLFGVTYDGGTAGHGTLFALKNTSDGYKHVTLWTFTGGTDGAEPLSPPVLTSQGALVGTTTYGPITESDSGEGVLYSFAKGTFTTLYTFTNDAHGGYPESTAARHHIRHNPRRDSLWRHRTLQHERGNADLVLWLRCALQLYPLMRHGRGGRFWLASPVRQRGDTGALGAPRTVSFAAMPPHRGGPRRSRTALRRFAVCYIAALTSDPAAEARL